MKQYTNDFVHEDFCLNAIPYTKEELMDFAQHSLRVSGQKHLVELGDFIVEWLDDNPYIVVQTSGTTGPPKQIYLTKQAVIYSARATGEFFNIHNKSKALLCMSTNFIAGKLMLVRALILGWDLHHVAPSSNVMQQVEGDFDFVAMVPMQVQASFQELNRIKCLIIGGAKVSASLSERLLSLDTRVYETYGMSETITHIAAKRICEQYFTILPHVSIEQDNRGCLVINAPNITSEPIITNDVVTLLNEKDFIWKGRIDNVINSGGIKLYPEEIEQLLSPKIPYPFFIGSKNDPILGNKVVLVIQAKAYMLEDTIFETLHRYQRPKEIQFCDTFITTESGKVIRSKNIK
ncbi:AMP-binding protein [Myroides sp. LJL115]